MVGAEVAAAAAVAAAVVAAVVLQWVADLEDYLLVACQN